LRILFAYSSTATLKSEQAQTRSVLINSLKLTFAVRHDVGPSVRRYNLRPSIGGERASNRRSSERHPEFLIEGRILVPGRSPMSCAVRDKNSNGARLELETAQHRLTAASVPDRFTLYFCPTKTVVDCRVAWRDGRHLGVQFKSLIRILRASGA
jgi:hypothetical protein